MALMRTSNPALNAKTFVDVRRDPTAPAMTVEGTVNRTAFLLFLVVVPAAWVWAQVRTALAPSVAGPWILAGAIGGFVVALVTIFKKEWSPVTAPIYAALERAASIEELKAQVGFLFRGSEARFAENFHANRVALARLLSEVSAWVSSNASKHGCVTVLGL